ncbi:nucleoside deaminase [Flavihumibacter solisilvae]|uniref:Guanine deaminase n=1 Tax=Flavihumibacter solisilvae TaxID=1349421 RepID=A0A0C1IG20_9BACT|nr:nucleoside deaminase [Flavihumibacter solisilvae]KIC93095.1 guanine deaminase [Flavihumibacter solisilvae]
MNSQQQAFLRLAIEEARKGMNEGQGGPFGCVIVKDGKVLVATHNKVLSTNDPTAHAEVVAIREACSLLKDFQLTGCEIYASCEPCPMCMGAIYWARPAVVYYAASRQDAAAAGFDDSMIYEELNVSFLDRVIPFHFHPASEATSVFTEWIDRETRTPY